MALAIVAQRALTRPRVIDGPRRRRFLLALFVDAQATNTKHVVGVGWENRPQPAASVWSSVAAKVPVGSPSAASTRPATCVMEGRGTCSGDPRLVGVDGGGWGMVWTDRMCLVGEEVLLC